MKVVADTIGGWMWYVTQVKNGLSRELTDAECKTVMKCYTSSKPFDKTVEELKNVSN